MESLKTRQNRPAVVGAGLLILAILILYLPPVFNQVSAAGIIYQSIVILLAVMGAGLSLQLAFSYKPSEVLRTIWLLLGIGLLLWSIGEALWGYYSYVQGSDPYPSIADAVWLVGFIPLIAAMALRFRTLGAEPERERLIAVGVISLILIGLAGVFIIRPMLLAEGSSPLEQAIGILYPLGDLAVALGALLTVLVLIGGRLSTPWMFIAVGFFINTGSDLIYIYAESQGLYYPDDALTLLSAIIDVSYAISYIFIDFGIYLMARLQKIL